MKDKELIQRAIKVNFGFGEPSDWAPDMYNFLLNPEIEKNRNRHNTHMLNDWYVRKFSLVQNYLRIYGTE
jgi:hypothetical protein